MTSSAARTWLLDPARRRKAGEERQVLGREVDETVEIRNRFWRTERGTPEYWAVERSMKATSRLFGILYGEAIKPIHLAGGAREESG